MMNNDVLLKCNGEYRQYNLWLGEAQWKIPGKLRRVWGLVLVDVF